MYIKNLAQALRTDTQVIPLSSRVFANNIALYTDDLIVYTTDPSNTVPWLKELTDEFGDFFGYQINKAETEIMCWNLEYKERYVKSENNSKENADLKYVAVSNNQYSLDESSSIRRPLSRKEEPDIQILHDPRLKIRERIPEWTHEKNETSLGFLLTDQTLVFLGGHIGIEVSLLLIGQVALTLEHDHAGTHPQLRSKRHWRCSSGYRELRHKAWVRGDYRCTLLRFPVMM
ncbi:hypothetical protein NDU88_004619 [Pleurodeles waltl]|uniref:Reverse transcriptase domain-containing protein n=1 Tax=Pleurodeles waltl TaxID=8319 RepID=A0AAV7PDC6_PLEWA|nr:hypothetical protein NDU88_004619 [Pleurodeles waltl]